MHYAYWTSGPAVFAIVGNTSKSDHLHNEYQYIHDPNNGMYNLYNKEPHLLFCSDPLNYLLYNYVPWPDDI